MEEQAINFHTIACWAIPPQVSRQRNQCDASLLFHKSTGYYNAVILTPIPGITFLLYWMTVKAHNKDRIKLCNLELDYNDYIFVALVTIKLTGGPIA